ncbi:5'-nucleotidase SurE [Salipiger pallidus]|uniref:5'-nucleotidase SurE n=1 Tax=Salipiger pallidus TaxID=1775170 RepID=A0A8J2ZGR0_9RHOB|nr:5'/3'-nucleotidase SurE [Salipiger pallidus]GGG60706.1 5'-nucleotidase SurE [Salipiger pallidus]
MRILITNDDGINAPGLAVLEAIATEIAGPEGEVWTVAPAFEQSGVGHCISYSRPMMVSELAPRRWAAEGSPADCVLAGIHDVLADTPPDLVLSGVNRGNNAAENVLYSGTIGGALEASLQGLPAIALSQYLGPQTSDLENPFEAAATYGAAVIRDILEKAPQDDAEYRLFWNVNFPPVPASDVRGVCLAPQGKRRGTSFATKPQMSPAGRKFLWVQGGDQRAEATPGSDAALNLEGHISVTPMRADFTAHDMLPALKDAWP